MESKVVSGIMLALLLIGMLTLAFNVQTTKAEGEASPVRDVAVTNVMPSQTLVEQGDPLTINVTVENQGDFTETFDVTAYYRNGTITPEQWETFWSMGDVNRDGYINYTDRDIIADAYTSTPSDPHWNPDADLNQDLKVDMDDLVIMSWNYGEDIWTYFISTAIETQTVSNLSPGDSTTLVFTWDTTGVALGDYTISAKVPIIPVELDVVNNLFVDGVVTIATPEDLTQKLIETIKAWDLDKGTEKCLIQKLEAAIHLLNKGKETGATHKLEDFISLANALSEKKLTTQQADQLEAEAQRIINLIEG